MTPAIDRVLAALEGEARLSGGQYQARCPAHEDRKPSLAIRPIEGSVLVYCHAGCSTEDVAAALGMTVRDFYDEPRGDELTRYVYTDAAGKPTRTVHRMDGKQFTQSGDKRIAQLFRLPQIIEAVDACRRIWLVEGEKDVLALETYGETATTAPMGAKNFHRVDVGPLKNATVVAVVDRDAAGEAWAELVTKRLAGFVRALKFVQAVEGKDAADHIVSGHKLDEFVPHQPAVAAGGWDDPLPLGWPTRLPAFPVHALPGVFGEYAAALAVETQTPVDLPGVVIVGTLAASIGGRVRVVVRRGWSEPTNIYAVPVLPPGSRKSAVVSTCEAPLDAAERQLLEELAPLIRDAMIERDVREKYAEQQKQKAIKQPDAILLLEAQDAARVAEDVRVPAWPRLLADDATPEALVKLLADQGGRIAALSAEAGIFDSLAGRYTNKTNLEPLLKAHAGDSIRVDRRSREPERVDRPALTMIASIQPYALQDMVSRPEFGGRGLLARVLWSLPADLVGYRDENAPPVSEALTARYQRIVTALAVDMYKRDTVVTLSLSDGAYKVLIEYMRQVEIMLRSDGPLGESRLLKDWGSKLVGAVARISGGLHVAAGLESLTEPIRDTTMEAAIEIGEYFRAHAVGALRSSDEVRGQQVEDSARTLLAYLGGKGLDSFVVRDLRSGPKALRTAQALRPVIEHLAERGWVREAQSGGWEVHPDAGRLLGVGDRGDRGDSEDVPAAHDTYHPVAPTVAHRGDAGDTQWPDDHPFAQPSPPVAPVGDTMGDTHTGTLISENVTPVAPVAPVAPIPATDQRGRACPECDQVPTPSAWGPCVRCQATTHRYSRGSHGPLCGGCRASKTTERKAS